MPSRPSWRPGRCATTSAPSPDYPWLVERERALYGAWYEFFPRSEGCELDETTGLWKSGTFATAAERLPAVAAMGFDVIYLTPIHPIGTINRKGPNNTLIVDEHDPGSPYAIGSADGGHDAIHPELGTFDDFDAFVARAGGTRPRGGAGPGAAVRARPPLGEDQSGMVHHPQRRHHRVRGEPAEEVPGHLPAELRQRPEGHLRGDPPGGAGLDRPRRQDLPGRQSAHQAGGILGMAHRRRRAEQPRGDLAGRGIHPAGDDARPRQDRFPAVVHLLRVAQREMGPGELLPGTGAGFRALHAAEFLADHARHPDPVHDERRPGRLEAPGRAGRPPWCRPTGSTPATS